MKKSMRFLREPLFHFLIIGGLLFVAYTYVSSSDIGGDAAEIRISQAQIEALANGFAKTWMRPARPDELAGLVRSRVREEVYYREAIAMGLDKGDAVIRNRLRQKMEFIFDDIAAQGEPTDAELNEYLQAHPETFHVEPLLSFDQVYLSPEKHGEHLARDAAQLLALLKQAGNTVDTAMAGDSMMLGHQFTALRSSEVSNLFGEQFAATLNELALGQWQGPVESAYGLHLVLMRDRVEAHSPELAEVREAVEREWANANRLDANEKRYQEFLENYTVTIEQ